MLITSCQKGIDTFKDHYVNYSFSKYADDKKVDALYAGMSLGRQQLSSISTKHQIYQTSTNSVISENTESEVIIKEDKNNPDYLILETKEAIENISSKNGITIVDQIKK